MRAQARALVDERGALPAERLRKRRVQRADPLHGVPALTRERAGDRHGVDRPEVGSDPLRREHGPNPFDAPEAGGEPAHLAGVASGRAHGDRRREVRREALLEDVVDLPGLLALRQHGCVDRREEGAQERQSEGDHHRGGGDGDPPRPPHHELRQAVPRAALGRPRVGVRGPTQPLRREGVDPRPEGREDGGQHQQRDACGDDRHQRAADPHRVEEALREHEQRRHRRRDGERAEQHGSSGRPQGRRESREPGPALGHLLAVARDHEEAVVDGETQAEPGHEVQREHRQVHHLAHTTERGEREHDREAADDRRKRGGNEASEEPERQQEQEGEGEQLGVREVCGHDAVRRPRSRREAAEPHIPPAGETVPQAIDRLLLVDRSLEAGAHERVVAVARDHPRRSTGERRGDVLADVRRINRANTGAVAERERHVLDGAQREGCSR